MNTSNQMSNRVLGNYALTEIREAIQRCNSAKEISAEAERLASHFGVSKSRIYDITTDVRPKRKTRADKGKRIAELMQHEGLKYAASVVVEHDINPADALNMTRLAGYEIPVDLDTFRRYMREHGLDKKTRRTNRTSHRRFEAEAPGEIYQFDISGLKERWFDLKTRKIITVSNLEVSKNHPNEVQTRVKIWRFNLIDDFSRYIFTRFYAVDKPNGTHVVDFLLQAYEEMGVPLKLYADNDVVIKYGRNKRATEILHKATADCGGYEVVHHLPGNARATGKVESSHKRLEQNEKLIGWFLQTGRELTIDTLNDFARSVCTKLNDSVHRETLEKPFARWNSRISVVRKLDYQALRAAFLADEFDVLINGDVTFKLKGQTFQLPTSDDVPFAAWIDRRVKVIFADDLDFFTLIGLDGLEYDITKQLAAPDTAGNFKANAESSSERNRKELKKFAKDKAREIKEAKRQGADVDRIAPIPHFDVPYETEKTNVARFPKKEIEITPQRIAEVAPNRASLIEPEEKYSGKLMTFWDAIHLFQDQFSDLQDCKQFLDTVFADREDQMPQSAIDSALRELQPAERKLRLA